MVVNKHIFLATAVAVVLIGCSSAPVEETPQPAVTGYKYSADIPLSPIDVSSEDESISVRVPEGWSRATLDGESTEIILWLVNGDYSASITFMPIQMDPELYQALKRDGVSAVTKVSMSLKEGNLDTPMTVVQPAEPFELGGRKFYAYEYSVNNKATIVRVVVFDTGTRFLECACVPATEQTTPAMQRDLFRAQQTVLNTLKVQ